MKLCFCIFRRGQARGSGDSSTEQPTRGKRSRAKVEEKPEPEDVSSEEEPEADEGKLGDSCFAVSQQRD